MDPKYAAAWALRPYLVDTTADVELMDRATAFQMGAKMRNEQLSWIPTEPKAISLAWVQINRDWNWEGAEISLNKAAELEPGIASLLRYRSFLSHSLGRLNEAITFHQQAIAIDPLFASSYSYLPFLLYCVGDYDKAEATARKT